jgi:hypothetical protein
MCSNCNKPLVWKIILRWYATGRGNQNATVHFALFPLRSNSRYMDRLGDSGQALWVRYGFTTLHMS